MAGYASDDKVPPLATAHLESPSRKNEHQHPEHVPAGHEPRSAEEKALNKRLNRKLDIALLPFLSLLYLFNGLDRGNVGNAETQGMKLACLYVKENTQHM